MAETDWCPKCQLYELRDGHFCSSCGEKLIIPPPKRLCPKCGEEARQSAKFCSDCGEVIYE